MILYTVPMSFFPRPSRPTVVWADLKAFLSARQRHEWAFMGAALAIPIFLVTLFMLDERKIEYRPPDITYVRTITPGQDDSKIRAFHDDLAKDVARRDAEAAKTRKTFQEIEKKMKKWGM
jgi:hypothetical protein